MKKLRLLITSKCNRSCSGCCNKDWDLKSLPKYDTFKGYDEILLTGGEPMLFPELVLKTVLEIRKHNTDCKIMLYTAKVDNMSHEIIDKLDGITFTLHEQSDTSQLRKFNIEFPQSFYPHISFRLNIFKNITSTIYDTLGWMVKPNMDWVKDCPLPKDEVFKRLKA